MCLSLGEGMPLRLLIGGRVRRAALVLVAGGGGGGEDGGGGGGTDTTALITPDEGSGVWCRLGHYYY